MKIPETAQEIFDTVLFNLRKQGVAAMDDISSRGYSCVYRSRNGNKCAAGWCIPDDLYSPTMEGKVISAVMNEYAELHYLDEFIPLLSILQDIHDTHMPRGDTIGNDEKYNIAMNDWETCMERTARKFHLHYTPRTGD